MIFWLAPMDWISDLPFRVITKKIFDKYNTNPDHKLRLWTEFMTSDGYVANPHKVIKHVINTPDEYPLILQIFGGKREKLLHTALDLQKKYWNKKNILGIELNTGCPSNTVIKNWWWSALLKCKEETLETIKTLSKNLDIPFSIKTRTGLNEEDKKAQMEFLIKASQYCHTITVHARTLKELYSWEWDREFIYELKRQIQKTWNNCKVLWNWAVKTYQDIANKVKKLDWVMIAQASIGNPRVFTNHIPSIKEKFETIIEHFELMAKYEIFTSDLTPEDCHSEQSEESINKWQKNNKINPLLSQIESINIQENYKKVYYTPLLFRKYLHQYLKWIEWSKELKELCNKTKDFNENIKHITNFFKNIM